jgi:hypothetical protein
MQRALPGEDRNTLSLADNVERQLHIALRGILPADRRMARRVMGHIPLRTVPLPNRRLLHIDRDRDMSHSPPHDCRANRKVRHRLHVRSAHHPLVVTSDIHEDLVQLDVLLRKRARHIAVLHPGNCQNRLLVHLRVIKPVQQMNPARPRGRKTNTKPPRELGISAGHERSRLLMPHVNEANLVLRFAQRFHHAVDTVAGKPEDRIHAPRNQPLYKYIRSIH